jgi:hypothetical protein
VLAAELVRSALGLPGSAGGLRSVAEDLGSQCAVVALWSWARRPTPVAADRDRPAKSWGREGADRRSRRLNFFVGWLNWEKVKR